MEELDDELRAFIAEFISSIAQLELILLLAREPGRNLTADDAAKELALSPEMTAQILRQLERLGIAAASEKPPNYRYGPRDARIDTLVKRLAEAYAQRRVTVIQLIYRAPPDAWQRFADAFDFRKKKREGN